MKYNVLHTLSAILAVGLVLLSACAREELPDQRDLEYGYVQFKVYKEASYQTKVSYDLDSLSQAGKINVLLTTSSGRNISQTLTLTSSDLAAADFGLRSSKLKLLEGEYTVVSYQLYDHLDQALTDRRTVVDAKLVVTAGGMEVFDLTANVAPRGQIKFSLVKDMSDFKQDADSPVLDDVSLRSKDNRSRQYTFDEVKSMDITLVNIDDPLAARPSFTGLPVEYSQHFLVDETYEGLDGVAGFQTSTGLVDTLVYAPAGRYKIYSFVVYDDDDVMLETEDYSQNYSSQENIIVVEDNKTAEADVPLTLYEDDEYLQDNYALYLLWKALGGENWSYVGQTYNKGCNWDFNKDPDLWCVQPGVQVHANGRIASIDLSGFGIRGEVPAAIGQFTELVQLTLGSHSETNHYYDTGSAARSAAYPVNGTSADRAAWRKNKYSDLRAAASSMPPLSPVCALALRLNGKTSVAASMYDGMTEDEISLLAAGRMKPSDYEIRPYDLNHGVLTNGLTGIHENLGKLTKLESLSIANSPITADKFPNSLSQLSNVTDLEVYNCPNLETLPECFSQMSSLITVNFSNNEFSAAESYNSLNRIASGRSRSTIQIIYYLQNGLEELPQSIGNMLSLGMLNVSYNNIKGALPSFGDKFTPEELTFDHNAITSVPDDFCSLEALSSFSIGYNELTEFPNFFSSDEKYYIMTSINVAHNKIKAFPADFKGIKTVTLTLSGNPMETFPKELAETDSYVETLAMQSCGLKEFPKDCLGGKNTFQLTTMDLQYNCLSDLPEDFSAQTLPYLYGMDLTGNCFSEFPLEPLNVLRLTAFSVRGQRDASGERCLRTWPTGLYTHTGLRGFYIGGNDLRLINDTISYLIYYLDISDNPQIIFDASDICSAWQSGVYYLYYDPDQTILNCDAMLE